MTALHQELTQGKWQSLSFFYQMANVGAEIGRTINWKKKDAKKSTASFERGLELLDMTIEDKKNQNGRLKELCRLREVLVDYFTGTDRHGSTDESWNKYFYFFNAAASAKYF